MEGGRGRMYEEEIGLGERGRGEEKGKEGGGGRRRKEKEEE